MKFRALFRTGVCVVCAVCIMLCLLPGQVLAEENGKYLYEVQDGKAIITGCTWENASYLDIPRTIDGYPVVSIGANAFQSRKDLQGVIIPEGVESVDYRAFFECRNLMWVNLPDSLTTIGEEAFSVCAGLQSVTFGSGLKTIGYGAFAHCGNLGYYLDFAEGLETIGDSAFYKCYSLETVLLPKSLTRLGSRSFAYCIHLEELYIPDGVDSVGEEVLYDTLCYKNSSNWYANAFYMRTYLMEVKKSVSGSYAVAKGTTHIADSAFQYCHDLTEVILPDSLRVIGECAFEKCDSLQSIVIPEGVTRIDDKAYYNCTAAAQIQFPESVAYLGKDVFTRTAYYQDPSNWENNVFYLGKHLISSNAALSGTVQVRPGTKTIVAGALKDRGKVTELIFPEGLTTIGNEAVAGCTALSKITLCGTVSEIGEKAFYNCTGLKTLRLGENVTEFNARIFGHCSSLETITVDDSNPVYSSLDNCVVQGSCLIMGCRTSKIPQCVTEIGPYAFEGCAGLTELTVPEWIITIGEGAFRDCDGLTAVRLGNGVQVVGVRAFEECDVLSSVDLGQSVHTIEDFGFAYNNRIQRLDFPTSLRHLGREAFSNAIDLTSVNFREGLVSIGEACFIFCENLKAVRLPDSLEKLGSGAFYDCHKMATLHLGKGLVSIEDAAFMYCEALQVVKLPDNIQTVGSHAFSECKSLQLLDLGQVQTIGSFAFSESDGLIQIHIPATVKEIGLGAFAYCPKLESLTVSDNNSVYFDRDNCIIHKEKKVLAFGCKNSIIPADGSVTMVNGYSFAGAVGLKFIQVPIQVTWIGAGSFHECTGMEEIHLPFIGGDADSYYGYLGYIFNVDRRKRDVPATLERVVILGGTNVVTSAFADCAWLKEIVLPETINWIGYDAFRNCTHLEKVVLPAELPTIKDEDLFATAPNGALYLSQGKASMIQYAEDQGIRHYVGGLINFEDENGRSIDRIWYSSDWMIAAPKITEKEGYSWSPALGPCKGDQTIRYCSETTTPEPPEVAVQGDLNGDAQVNNRDVEYLLWHTLFPEKYPVPESADYQKDGLVNNRDVQYLLWHTLFPDTYPI